MWGQTLNRLIGLIVVNKFLMRIGLNLDKQHGIEWQYFGE